MKPLNLSTAFLEKNNKLSLIKLPWAETITNGVVVKNVTFICLRILVDKDYNISRIANDSDTPKKQSPVIITITGLFAEKEELSIFREI
ncbi:hypothetical protein AEQU3_02744 [Aequorivita antarctica]|nr:hypothetical protein AEQU3_02744 [Aequorivita antarctica]